jgi:capsid portal protein
MAGWRAQAEFNVRFFDNHAVPAYAVVIEGADVTPELEEKILDHFKAIKGDPHRTLVIPVPGIPGDEATQVKVRFEKLAVDIKDASFRLYKQDNALEICIAHGSRRTASAGRSWARSAARPPRR